jgi:hypothetical protein
MCTAHTYSAGNVSGDGILPGLRTRRPQYPIDLPQLKDQPSDCRVWSCVACDDWH